MTSSFLASAYGFATRDTWRGRPYLLSPLLDFLMVGGAGLMVLLLISLLLPYEKHSMEDAIPAAYIVVLAAWLSFAVNYPHFIVSYQLLYRNFPTRLKRMKEVPAVRWRLWMAGVVVPVFLLALLAYVFWRAWEGDLSGLGIGLSVMLFFVGWHYVKQAFGVFIMLSSLKHIFYSPVQRKWLLINAYTVWFCSWIYMTYTGKFPGAAFQQDFLKDGTYTMLQGHDMPLLLLLPLVAIPFFTSVVAFRGVALQWREKKARPSITALIGYSSMYYLWAFATLLHAEWTLVIAFFHSLQYLLFVIAYKRGEVHSHSLAHDLPEAETKRLRKKLRNRAQEFFGWAFLFGALAFNIVPVMLGHKIDAAYPGQLPAGFMLLLFLIFINIHHYFIDNVIWRKENQEVGVNLIQWRQQRNAP